MDILDIAFHRSSGEDGEFVRKVLGSPWTVEWIAIGAKGLACQVRDFIRGGRVSSMADWKALAALRLSSNIAEGCRCSWYPMHQSWEEFLNEGRLRSAGSLGKT